MSQMPVLAVASAIREFESTSVNQGVVSSGMPPGEFRKLLDAQPAGEAASADGAGPVRAYPEEGAPGGPSIGEPGPGGNALQGSAIPGNRLPLGLPPGLLEPSAALEDGGFDLVPPPLAPAVAVVPVPAVVPGAGNAPATPPAGETPPARLETGPPIRRESPGLAHRGGLPAGTEGAIGPAPASAEAPPAASVLLSGTLVAHDQAAQARMGPAAESVEEGGTPESGLRTEARAVLPGSGSAGVALTPVPGALSGVGAAGPAPPAPAAMLTLPVNAPFGSGPWSEDVAGRIVWIAKHDHTMARLELNPPDLGPIHVRLSVQGEHAQVSINAHHALTREALDGSLDRLRDALLEEGFTQVDVNVGQDRGRNAQPHAGFPELASRTGPTEAPSEAMLRPRVPLGLLDHYA
jgi:flagellar hook-length control protein FliK